MTTNLVADPATELNAVDAAAALAAALRASPEFVALALAGDRLAGDTDAQTAIGAFNAFRSELAAELAVGVLDVTQRAELEHRNAAMLACDSVSSYLDAQAAFAAVCRDVAGVVTDEIGIDFAANCRSGGCCG